MFQFPASPALDQIFSPVGGPSYQWNGTGWVPFTLAYTGGLSFTGPVLHADGTLAAPGISWANEPSMGFYRPVAGSIIFASGGSAIFSANSANFFANKPALFMDGTLAAPGISWSSESSMGLYRNTTSQMQFVIGGTAVFGMTATGAGVAGTFGVGGQTTVGGQLLVANGTVGAPGIAFSALPHSGIWRDPSTHNLVFVYNSTAFMRLNPGYVAVDTTFYAGATALSSTLNVGGATTLSSTLNVSGAVTMSSSLNVSGPVVSGDHYVYSGGTLFGHNPTNTVAWYMVHGSSNTNLYIGHTGWTNTLLFGGGVQQVTVSASGVGIAGTLGVTGAITGSLSGNASYALYLRSGAAAGGMLLPFHWVHPGGGPAYVWGSPGDGNSYIYPQGTISAGYAANSGQVNGLGGWTYANSASNPVYVWCTDGDPQYHHLTQPGYLHVAYAANAGHATTAGAIGEGGSNSSLHPDSSIEMADGSKKWLRDVRIGDMVRGRDAPAEVLGMWTNVLAERALWEVNGVGCTPGHLFVTRNGWGAASPALYVKNSHDKRRIVKGRSGMIVTHTLLAEPGSIDEFVLGMELLAADGSWQPIHTLKEYPVTSKDVRITANQHVIALHLAGSDVFYADGYAVSTLA